MPQRFNPLDPHDYANMLNIAQHHGYPTPLLDWSKSPYVATFFEFRDASKTDASNKKVRILKFCSKEWDFLPRTSHVYPAMPHVTVIEPLHYGNLRAIPQQALSTFTNVDDIEGHIQLWEQKTGKTYLEAIDLPVKIRAEVMNDLDLMGINAASLFPNLDGAFEALRERNFQAY